DREVVGFRTAAREDDLRRIRVDERGYLRSRLVKYRFRLLPVLMHARRIAERFAADTRDCVDDFGRERGRRVVVKIDTHGESFIVAFPLTIGNKRTRQRFYGHLYLQNFCPGIATADTLAP